jgi:hypothetical protein
MTTVVKKTVLSEMAGIAAETTCLAATAQQAVVDALRMEVGTIQALAPRLAAQSANSGGSRAADDAAREAMFDNMPI